MEASATTFIFCVFLVSTQNFLVDAATTQSYSVTASTYTFSFFSSSTPWSSTPYSSSLPSATVIQGSNSAAPLSSSVTHTTTKSSSTTNSSTAGNTNTQSTQPSTTTEKLISCKNGTCVGNESSCINETITDMCFLTSSQHCFQIVYENGTDTYYDVGCSSNCEFLVETTESVTRTTRCCDTDLCNNELLEDPVEENAAMTMTLSCFTTILATLVFIFLK